MYKSKLHNANETKQILKNGSRDVFFKVYYKKKKGPTHPGDKTVNKSRMDRLEKSIANLAKQMNTRFDKLEKDADSLKRDVKDINARLDYNGLKKLPESK